MKFSVLLSILFDLLSKQKLTASYLAEKHSLSPRTVYRYVNILSEYLPLQIKRGRNGGVRLADNYKLPVGFMSETEYDSAIEALDVAYAERCEERFLEARRKLSAQKKTEKRNLALFGDTGNVFVGCGSFGDLRTFAEKLRIVEECVKKKLALDVTYLEENGKKSFQRIEPHVLVFDSGVWWTYAFGHTQRNFQLFNLGKILSVTKTDTVFRKRPFPRDDIPFPSRRPIDTLYVRFEIQKSGLTAAQNWLGAECMRLRNGVWIAETVLPDEENLAAKIVSLGGGVKVLEPLSLREKIARIAREVAALYP